MSPTPSLTSNLLLAPRAITRSCQMACAQVFPPKTLIRTYCWLGCKRPSSISRSSSQVASFVTNVKAIYSILVDKRVNVSYLFKHQFTRSLLSMKMKLKIDFQLFISLASSKSEYLSISSLFWLLQVIPCLFEPIRYHKVIFTALVCWWSGFFTKRLVTEMVKVMSGLVLTIENMRVLVIPQ